jgi:hypothetical protein
MYYAMAGYTVGFGLLIKNPSIYIYMNAFDLVLVDEVGDDE